MTLFSSVLVTGQSFILEGGMSTEDARKMPCVFGCVCMYVNVHVYVYVCVHMCHGLRDENGRCTKDTCVFVYVYCMCACLYVYTKHLVCRGRIVYSPRR